MKLALTAFLILGVSAPAFARDSSHLVCSGFMASEPSPDNYGISIQFDEFRAEAGRSREEALSAIWAGHLYQGSRINRNDGFGENGKVKMTADHQPKSVFYAGRYDLARDAAGNYVMKLKGRLNGEVISTELPCVDISN